MGALTFDALLRSLKQGAPDPVYYLHGEEDVLKDEAVRVLLERAVDPAARDFNVDQRTAADLDPEAFNALVNTPPILAATRAVVLRGMEQLRKTAKVRQELLHYLDSPNPSTVLVLVHGTPEPPDAELLRRATAVEVAALPPERVVRWMTHRAKQLGFTLAPEAEELLLASVGNDLSSLARELEKLAPLCAGRPATRDEVAALVGVRRGETLQDFVDAALERRAADAARLVEPVLEQAGMSGVRMLSALGTALVGTALAREIEKLAPLCAGRPVTRDEVAALVGVRRGETLQDFVDAALERRAADAARLVEPVLEQAGMSGVRMLSALGTALVGTALARAELDRDARRRDRLEGALLSHLRTARPYGLGSWEQTALRWARWAELWTRPELRSALRLALDADRALKSSTLTDEAGILEQLVLSWGVRVPAVCMGRLRARAAHTALLRSGRSRGHRPSGRAVAPRLSRLFVAASGGLLGRARLLRPQGRRTRLLVDPRGAGRRGCRRGVQESGHLLRLALCLYHPGPPGHRTRYGGRHSGEARVSGRDVCRPGVGGEERGAGGRDAHASESDGLRRPRGA